MAPPHGYLATWVCVIGVLVEGNGEAEDGCWVASGFPPNLLPPASEAAPSSVRLLRLHYILPVGSPQPCLTP